MVYIFNWGNSVLNFGMVILHPTGIMWVSTVLYSLSRVKWLEHDGDHAARYITGVKNEWNYIITSLCSVGSDSFVFLVPYYHQANVRKKLSLGCEHLCYLLQFNIAFDTSTPIWQHYKATCIVIWVGEEPHCILI